MSTDDLQLAYAVLPPDGRSSSAARLLVAWACRLLRMEPDGPVSVAAELAANAIQHAPYASFTVRIFRRASTLHLEVRDQGGDQGFGADGGRVDLSTLIARDVVTAGEAESGRGLLIAASLADELEYRSGLTATVVSAAFTIPDKDGIDLDP